MDMNIYINIYLHGVSHFLGCGEIVDLNECPIWDHSQNVCHDHDFMLGVIVPAFLEVVHLVLLLFCQYMAIGIGRNERGDAVPLQVPSSPMGGGMGGHCLALPGDPICAIMSKLGYRK